MSEVERKRQALLTVYPGDKWADKVKKMPEAQVIAVYMNLKRQNKL
jgi:hypothetical protein